MIISSPIAVVIMVGKTETSLPYRLDLDTVRKSNSWALSLTSMDSSS